MRVGEGGREGVGGCHGVWWNVCDIWFCDDMQIREGHTLQNTPPPPESEIPLGTGLGIGQVKQDFDQEYKQY